MKHVQYEAIVAKAANMELVVLSKSNTGINGTKWSEVPNSRAFPSCEHEDYFLCVPKYKDICLKFLNGETLQVGGNKDDSWEDAWNNDIFSRNWSESSVFMDDSFNLRIKPKTEKRWIAVDPSTTQCTRHYSTKESCFNSEFSGCDGNSSGWQFIEIEVEGLDMKNKQVKQEWDGEGLPPVDCMVKTKHGESRVISTSEFDGGVVTYTYDNDCFIDCCWATKEWVRPLKSN